MYSGAIYRVIERRCDTNEPAEHNQATGNAKGVSFNSQRDTNRYPANPLCECEMSNKCFRLLIGLDRTGYVSRLLIHSCQWSEGRCGPALPLNALT